MSKLRKAFALSASDWPLVAQAVLWLAVVETGLRFLPLRTLLRLLGPGPRSFPGVHCQSSGADAGLPERAASCIELASRIHPLHPTCLRKALVLYAILVRKGFKAQIMIGVARDGQKLDAHAWLEYQGRIVFGAPAPQRYSPLCALENSLVQTGSREQAAS